LKYEDLDAKNKKIADMQSDFITELKSVDNVVISAPLWNFGIPAILKSYIDLVVKVGETFSM
jgi:FMN-dependent NADH-azoreductase